LYEYRLDARHTSRATRIGKPLEQPVPRQSSRMGDTASYD